MMLHDATLRNVTNNKSFLNVPLIRIFGWALMFILCIISIKVYYKVHYYTEYTII